MAGSLYIASVILLMSSSALGNIKQMEKSTVETNFRTERSARVRRHVGNCSVEDWELGTLKNNTDVHIFTKDGNPAISLVWTGTQGAMLALTTMNYGIGASPSKLYRSSNYGRSFAEITSKISGAHILKDHGLRVNPVDSSHILLINDQTIYTFGGQQTTTIYRSLDSGETFETFTTSFILRAESLLFSSKNALKILVLSLDNVLYISNDFGKYWDRVATHVTQMRWDPSNGDFFYYTNDPTGFITRGGFTNELYRVSSADLSKTKIAQHVHSFGVQGEFLFVSIEYLNKNGSRVMHVSKDGGMTWNAAQIPLIGKEQFYSLLDMTEQMVFVHVDSAGHGGDGIIYTSDERGVIFSQSLDHHLYPSQGSLTDFYKVDSLTGVYITSQLLPDAENTVRSVITFDKGGTWESVSAPKGSVCPVGEKECKIQIHNLFSSSKGVLIPEFPKSSSSAPGIIMVHGNIGDALNLHTPSVYVTSDGGYTWNQPSELEGPHYFEIGDSGGILYAVTAFKPTNVLKFSVDQGQCWQEFKFVDKPILVTGLAVEPGLKSTVVGLWGWEKDGDTDWRSVTIDFGSVLKEPCRDADYDTWKAHESNDKFLKSEACLLGSEAVFKRRKKGAICYNGKNFASEAVIRNCPCTKTDYLCDYGYIRLKEDCVLDPDFDTSHKDICMSGEEEVILTKGYRKIPGDKCTGGFEPRTQLKPLHKSCIVTEEKKEEFGVKKEDFEVITFKPPSQASQRTGSTGLVVFLVLAIIALAVVLVFVIRRKWSSHLRVKYSPLNVDDNSGMPDVNVTDGSTNLLVNSGMNNGRPAITNSNDVKSYHDDSDEDLLVT